MRAAQQVLNGDKIKAEKVAKAARQAFPDDPRLRPEQRTASARRAGEGLGTHGVLCDQPKTPAGRDANSDLSR